MAPILSWPQCVELFPILFWVSFTGIRATIQFLISPVKGFSQLNTTEPYWWQVNIGSGNGLVPSGNKPLPAPMLSQTMLQFAVCHQASVPTEFNQSVPHHNKVKTVCKILRMPCVLGLFFMELCMEIIPFSLPELWFFWSQKIMRILPVPIQKSSSLHQQWLDFINKWYVLLIFFSWVVLLEPECK